MYNIVYLMDLFSSISLLSVILQNLKNYIGHHITSKLGKFKDHEIDVFATSLENYLS